MATTENTGLLTYIDEAGNKYLLYPVTRAEAVDGLEELLAQKAPASHVTDKNNPHGVTADQVGALPKSGGTMSGAIAMGGNKITGLGTPTDSADAVSKAYADQKYSPNNKPTPADIGAAPGGYGWGETDALNAPYGDPDNIDRTCTFVASQGNIPASGVWFGQYFASYPDGDMTVRAMTGPVGCVCKRHKFDGVWQPWEWENPPMVEGAVYRTTERYKGNPVYAKAVSLNLAGDGNKYVSVDDSMTEVVSFTAYLQNGILAYDLKYNSNFLDCFVNVDSGNFFVNSADLPGWTVKAIVKYIK